MVATIGPVKLLGETRPRLLPAYVSRRWAGFSGHAHGIAGYTCPQVCFAVGNVSAEKADVKTLKKGRCPW